MFTVLIQLLEICVYCPEIVLKAFSNKSGHGSFIIVVPIKHAILIIVVIFSLLDTHYHLEWGLVSIHKLTYI